jgi:membrane-associated phospholipid phosphatase
MKSVSGALALFVLVVSVTDGLAFTPNKTPLSSTQKRIETAGTVVAIALPITAGGIALYKHDRVGVAQLLVESALTIGTAYALKNIVREQRPDGSNYQSFPSDTTAIAASGSSFLWRRYGWEYGLPAAAMTEFVAYSRVQARQHRWYDTLASSGIAMGYSYLLGTRFRERHGVDTSLSVAPDGAMARLSYDW